jgi:hypothetical protein
MPHNAEGAQTVQDGALKAGAARNFGVHVERIEIRGQGFTL